MSACLYNNYYYYDSGGLSSGQPWMKLTMLLVPWQLIPFWIMRSSRGFTSLWCLFHQVTLLYCYYNNFLPVLLWLYTDCKILQERTFWSREVWQISKTWVSMFLGRISNVELESTSICSFLLLFDPLVLNLWSPF
jgi:hypothetical protein